MYRTLLFYCFLTTTILVQGQTAQEKTFFNLSYDNNQYLSILRVPFENMLSFDAASFSLGFEKYLSESLNLSATGSFGEVTNRGNSYAKILGFHVDLKYKLNNGKLLPATWRFGPYVSIGAGMINFEDITEGGAEGSMTELNISPEVGIDYRLSTRAKLFISTSYKINSAIRYREYSAGFGFSIKSRDNDKDGIINSRDNCPDEAGPEANNGCPYPDTDNDGVIDDEDLCPTEPGSINGCPDKDKDGVADKDDKCPDEAGKDNGCPITIDTDGDGIPDAEDKCPNEAGTVDGCPEEDPAAALVDTDNDGVPDNLDDCPTSKGSAENKGCPAIIPDLPVNTVHFESSSAEILPEYAKLLDQLAELMTQYDFNLELRGYADNTGGELYNMSLSKRRADGVKSYLMNKGISSGRIQTKAFGIKFPIANNDTENGRSLNRRTELRIVSK